MKDKITAYILSTAIVVLLIIAGPAQAFFLNLEANNSFVNQGETIAFTAEIEIRNFANRFFNTKHSRSRNNEL